MAELTRYTMQTYTGRLIDPAALGTDHVPLELITIPDLAHALALTNRFGGHTPWPYSVAQHSLLVASVLPPELKAYGLLHDAAEAYLGDLVAPVKKRLSEYGSYEAIVQARILERFGLYPVMPDAIRAADLAVGAAECRTFGIAVTPGREQEPARVTIKHEPWQVIEALYATALRTELPEAKW